MCVCIRRAAVTYCNVSVRAPYLGQELLEIL